MEVHDEDGDPVTDCEELEYVVEAGYANEIDEIRFVVVGIVSDDVD